jgi:hypothetical protein
LLLGQKFFGDILSLGVNANLLTYSYDKDKFSEDFDLRDPVVARGISLNTFSFGMGLLFRPRWWLAFGVSVDDLNRPNVAIGYDGFKKQSTIKLGACATVYPLMPQVDLMVAGDEVLLQSAVRQSFLDQKLNLLAGYDFSGADKKDLFLEANFVHGQFGLSYSYQYALTELSEMTSGSHRLTFQFSRGGFPRAHSTPAIRLDNPNFSVADSAATRLTGKISNREGIAKVEVWRNGRRVWERNYQPKPREENVRVDIPLVLGKNEIQIVVHGETRKSSKKILVACSPRSPQPSKNQPVIAFLPPAGLSITSGVIRIDKPIIRLECEIANVDTLAEVQMRINGSRLEAGEVRLLEKTAKKLKISSDLDLREGLNRVEVRASNRDGVTSNEAHVFYNPLLQDRLYRKMWAIVIGIDKYRDANIDPLNFAVYDALGVEKILREEFKFDRVITLYNEAATKDRIVAALDDSLRATEYEDAVVIFFAGHGYTEMTREGPIGYIVPYDGAWGSYRANLSMEQIRETSKIPKAKQIFYVIDACYGGLLLAKRGGAGQPTTSVNYDSIRTLTSKFSRDVLTAGGQGEEVLDGGLENHSIFTGRFLEGLRGAADYNLDSYVTATELSRYVKEKVALDSTTRHTRQTPQFGKLTADDGEFVFVRKW